jgi:hypothetical protein
MDTRRKLILIIVGGVIAAGVIVSIVAFVSRPRSNDAYLETAVPLVRDQDTGEVLVNDPNTVEPGETREVIVLGLENLYGFGLIESQVVTIRDRIIRFAEERLEGKYQTVTIRPQDIQSENGTIRTTIRLGDSDILLPITISTVDIGLLRVVIEDPSNTVGGTFDTGETRQFAD